MRRNLAILALLVGTILLGVAAGYVYIDQREIQIRYVKAMSHQGITAADETVFTGNMDLICKAMVVGPVGAGLILAGFAMVLLESRWLRRDDFRSRPPV